MSSHFAHVLQIRLTREELDALERIAEVHRCTVEEVVRAELCLSEFNDPSHSPDTHPHLRLLPRAREDATPENRSAGTGKHAGGDDPAC